MGFKKAWKGLVHGVKESLGWYGHDQIGNQVGQWMNNITGQTDAFNKSYDAQQQMWQQNNAYNDPQSQMERYIAAGLNPNLVASGANAGVATGTAPSMSAGGAGALSAVLSLYNMKAQNRLLNEQIALTKENSANTMTTNLINGRKANLLYYQDKYAEAEYKDFLKTGKIPESYLKSSWSGELTGLIKGLLSKYLIGS